MRSTYTAFLTLLCCAPAFAQAAAVSAADIAALAKTYFRDSSELPMDVTVTKLITSPSGKEKRSQGTVRVLFRGYNLESGRFSFNTNAGLFQLGSMHASLGPGFAAFLSAAFLASHQKNDRMEIEQATTPGGAAKVTFTRNCAGFEMNDCCTFPKTFCGVAHYQMKSGADGLIFDHFSMDSANLPVVGKVRDLGSVQITGFHVDGNYRLALLPGDPKPYLLPDEITVTVSTAKGKVAVTNRYTARMENMHAKKK